MVPESIGTAVPLPHGVPATDRDHILTGACHDRNDDGGDHP
jgi:hypothetical protein